MKILNNKPIRQLAIIVLLIGALALIWCLNQQSPPISVKRTVPAEKEVPAAQPPIVTSMLADNYHFRQDDDRWAQDHIGDTEDTMGLYGCTISAVAMAASNLLGKEYTPGELNKDLSQADGFTDRGWLIWAALPNVTDNKISALMYNQADHTHIKSCMDDGHYPIVKIFLNGSYVHWVLVVGTTENDYLIRDPFLDADEGPTRLSERADKIHSIRCIVDNP